MAFSQAQGKASHGARSAPDTGPRGNLYKTWKKPLSARSAARRRLLNRRFSFKPRLEHLEDRLAPSVYVVTNTFDNTNPGSLRWAITEADAHPGPNAIHFDIGTGGPRTITLGLELPAITDSVTIDGSTQPGWQGQPIIQLDGSGTPNADGLIILAGGCTIKNLVLSNFVNGFGIHIFGTGATGNTVLGNFLGTDLSGTKAAGNNTGVVIDGGASGNTIGGAVSADRNIISGNVYDGVRISDGGTSNNTIEGNYIGTDITGKLPLADKEDGVRIDSAATGNRVGFANIISGNRVDGVSIDAASGNIVLGNLIGTSPDGTAPVPNGHDGIELSGVASANTVGGLMAIDRNVISGNASIGVDIRELGTSDNLIEGNFIGVGLGSSAPHLPNAAGIVIRRGATANTIGGTAAGAGNTIAYNGSLAKPGPAVWVIDPLTVDNTIRDNSIHNNTGLGINLGGSIAAGPDTAALPDDSGSVGPNDLLNYPILSLAQSGVDTPTQVVGTLSGLPNTTYTLDFYASNGHDPSGYGQGADPLGSESVTTDSNGNAFFDTSNYTEQLAPSQPGQYITATTTDASGNTSEFSDAIINNSVLVRWVSTVAGDWDTLSNWEGGAPPTATEDALIEVPGITVTHNQASPDSAHSLTSMVPITVTAGSLSFAAPSVIFAPPSVPGSDLTVSGTGALTIAQNLTTNGVTNSAMGQGILLNDGTQWNFAGNFDNQGTVATEGNTTLTGDFMNEGTLTLGASKPGGGIKHPHGNYTQTSAGDLQILIGAAGSSQLEEEAGTITLAGKLTLLQLGSSYPARGEQFTIIRNDTPNNPISGKFSDLPEGAIFSVAGLGTFQITYKGGTTGDDAVITCKAAAATTLTASPTVATPFTAPPLFLTMAPSQTPAMTVSTPHPTLLQFAGLAEPPAGLDASRVDNYFTGTPRHLLAADWSWLAEPLGEGPFGPGDAGFSAAIR